MMTPYLIIDSELCRFIENAARRWVDVRIIVPRIPDKQLIFEMTHSCYARLMAAGVQVYEYEPGFIHAKCYLADDKIAMVGTIHLDYRSLVHHFENGVWMYRTECLPAIRQDFASTFAKSIHVDKSMLKKHASAADLHAGEDVCADALKAQRIRARRNSCPFPYLANEICLCKQNINNSMV